MVHGREALEIKLIPYNILHNALTLQVVLLDLMGGKSRDVPVSATALPSRPQYWIIIIAQWQPKVTGPAGREVAAGWVRALWKALVQCDIDQSNSGDARCKKECQIQ